MQNSGSDIYIYNSTGRPLNAELDANKYISLAKQLDTKRNALHFGSTEKQGEFVLGCSLRVERVGGREERVVCIAVYNSGSTPEIIDRFYNNVKEAIKKLDNFNYKIIGLWEEGDLDTLKQVSVPEDMMKYVFGKVLAGDKVSIKSSNPVAGISLIRQLSGYIGSLSPLNMVLSVSQYPIDNLVSISPMEPKPDFELDSENLIWKQIPDYKDYYLLLADTLVNFPLDVQQYRHLNMDSLSTYIKNRAFQEYRDQILEIFISTPASVNKFFELYINQKEAVDTFVRHWSSLTTQPLPINDKLSGLVILICSKKDNSYPSNLDFLNSESEYLRRIYTNIRSPKGKKAVDIDLLKNNIFLSYAIKDTITRIYKENDIELLNALFSVSLRDDYTKKGKFKKLIDDDLHSRYYEDLLSLLKTIANYMDGASGDGGKVFFESLIPIIRNRGYYFSDDLSKKELGNLKRVFGKEAFSESKKQQTSSSKTGLFLKLGALGVVVLLLIGTAGFILLGSDISDIPGKVSSLLGKNQTMINNDTIVGNASTTNTTSLSNETINDNSDTDNIIDFANVTSGPAPLTVQFSDQTENATGWLWDFGDNGTTNTSSNPKYTYERPGEYNVSLTVFIGNNSNNVTELGYIRVDEYKDENNTEDILKG